MITDPALSDGDALLLGLQRERQRRLPTLGRLDRNLTDPQLKALGDSGGIVRLNFAAMFLREDGCLGTDVSPAVIVRHVEGR